MKVALCLSGLCLSFRESYESIKKYWIDPFDTDVFLHTYDTLAFREREIPVRPGDFGDMQTMYHPVKMVVQSWAKMKSVFDTHKYDGRKKDRANPINTLSMYYNVRECNRLKSAYEELFEFRYDLVIRARFDERFNSVNESNYLNAKDGEVYIPWRDGLGSPAGDKTPFLYGGLNDQFAIGKSPSMDQYSDTYTYIDDIFNSGVLFHAEPLLKAQVVDRCKLSPIGVDIVYEFAGMPEDYRHEIV